MKLHLPAMKGWFARWLLPGFVFQSTFVAGGYGTGREIAQFFLPGGPRGGLYGIALATVLFSFVLVAVFEFGRVMKAYDYKSFFDSLLGPLSPLMEVGFVTMMVVVLAIIGAAAGEIVSGNFGGPTYIATILLLAFIAFLVYSGTGLIERFMAGWSFLLYATYIGFFIAIAWLYGDQILANIGYRDMDSGWAANSLTYAGYNFSVFTVFFFVIRHLQSRKDAVVAGLLAGPIGTLPALLFFLCMSAFYPEIGDVAVPVDAMLAALDAPWFHLLFGVILFGTFIESGTAVVHAINERIDHAYRRHAKRMPDWLRPVVGAVMLLFAIYIATTVGLVDLVGEFYPIFAWVFIFYFALPVVTVGVWMIRKRRRSADNG